MEVTPPFGQEDIIVYASTSPLGEINVAPAGGVYEIKTKPDKIAIESRGGVFERDESWSEDKGS